MLNLITNRSCPAWLAAFIAVLLAATPLDAQITRFAAMPQHVHVQLLADVADVAPDATFHLGVLFKIDPGWHIYWRNAGDAGVPTTVSFTLPLGFTQVGKLQWPTPQRFGGGSDDPLTFGYRHEALLIATIRAPSDLSGMNTASFLADVRWLVCKDVCLPGDAKLELDLPVGAPPPQAAHQALFDTWLKNLPVNAAAADSPLAAHVDSPRPHTPAGNITITLTWKDKVPPALEFFPVGDPALVFSHMHSDPPRAGAKQTTLHLHLHVLTGLQPRNKITQLLVVYPDDHGKRRGVYVPIPLTTQETRP